jgi:hypothetical protein
MFRKIACASSQSAIACRDDTIHYCYRAMPQGHVFCAFSGFKIYQVKCLFQSNYKNAILSATFTEAL